VAEPAQGPQAVAPGLRADGMAPIAGTPARAGTPSPPGSSGGWEAVAAAWDGVPGR